MRVGNNSRRYFDVRDVKEPFIAVPPARNSIGQCIKGNAQQRNSPNKQSFGTA